MVATKGQNFQSTMIIICSSCCINVSWFNIHLARNLCHICGYACQQMVLKAFPGPSPLHGWSSLTMTFTGKFVYIYIYIQMYMYRCICIYVYFCKYIYIIYIYNYFLKTDNISTCCLSHIFFTLQNFIKSPLQIKRTIDLDIEQITSIKWLTMTWCRKLIDLIIYVHIVNPLQLTVQT